ncbi:MAG: c-type cytochrome [Undibacterium sp.]|nr:c-type cytochrome [Opitutaceae bacterium]
MILPKRLRALLALIVLGVAASAVAQIGDNADKPGAPQVPLVPADKIPAAPALSPEEALKSFTLQPGFKLEIAAAEPLVQDPVAMTFGPDGRMWVVEMRGYMADLDGNGEDAPVGRIVVLTDRDGDGRYDESKVFLDNLILPRAITLVGDGVLVGAPPELAFWRDTDGDGKADKKTLLATDYGVKTDQKRPFLANPERAPNGLLWAHDNWIYSAAYTKKFRYTKGEWETGVTIFRGQWGLSQDDFGHLYHDSNSDPLRVDVISSDYLQRNPNQPRLAGTNVNAIDNFFVWPARVNPGINRGYRPEFLRDGKLKEFTAANSPWIYRGDLMPEFYGDAFIAEPAGNFVRRNLVKSENGTIRSRNAYAAEQKEFIASTDERFRPVGFTTGPDGALYIIDLYRGVLQHRISLTSYLRKQSEDRKLANPQHLGRIYRMVPIDRAAPRVTQIPALTNAQWVERLSHPNSWWRETAQRLLVERRDSAVVSAIRQVALRGASPLGRMHALWTLDGVEALDRKTVLTALDDPDPVPLTAAIRLSERFFKAGADGREELIARVLPLTNHASPEVQLQAVLTLGEHRDINTDLALAETVRLHPDNVFLRDALISGLADRELPLLERLVANPAWATDDAPANLLLSGIASGALASRQISSIERLIALIAAQKSGSERVAALLDGMFAGMGGSRRALKFQNEPAGWAELLKNPENAKRLAKFNDLIVWPGKTGLVAVAAVQPLTAEQQTRFENGKALFTAICAACHQITGRGLDGLAPPLLDSEWVLGSPEKVVRIVLHGVRGPIKVAGRMHAGDMPAHGALDDTQISSVLTYIRREWGHDAPAIDPAQVAAIRATTKNHTDAWSPEELNLIK